MIQQTKILAEVPEHRASGEIRAIFADLKGHVGVVALIYRHLATFPGVLEWAWCVLRPAFENGQMRARAARVRSAVDLDPARRWDVFPVRMRDQFARADLAGIGDVLDGYNRTNPTNILGVFVLGRALGAPAGTASGTAEPLHDVAHGTPRRLPNLPPPVAIADLSPDLAAAIAGLASRGVTQGDAIVPSLYRHLANWPGYLAAAANVLRPLFASGDIEAMANRVRQDAQAEAEAVWGSREPVVPPPFDGATQTAVMNSLDMFARRIPEMTVVGMLLRAALPVLDEAGDGGIAE